MCQEWKICIVSLPQTDVVHEARKPQVTKSLGKAKPSCINQNSLQCFIISPVSVQSICVRQYTYDVPSKLVHTSQFKLKKDINYKSKRYWKLLRNLPFTRAFQLWQHVNEVSGAVNMMKCGMQKCDGLTNKRRHGQVARLKQ